jgi:hypothetical protein
MVRRPGRPLPREAADRMWMMVQGAAPSCVPDAAKVSHLGGAKLIHPVAEPEQCPRPDMTLHALPLIFWYLGA